jgi:hypothetical protein
MKKIVSIVFGFFICLTALSKVIIYPAPKGEPVSADFSVSVNNKPLFVYQARVSAMPVNQVWPGYQRPLEQTELASFCYFDADEEVEIEIESTKEVNNVAIRPLSSGIQPAIEGNNIKFKIKKTCQLVVEINDWHKALHIFANPVGKDVIDKSAKDVLYFGPGIHNAGIISARDNQTIFIAGGAVVNGVVVAKNVKNLKITGRGIIDASMFERGGAGYLISMDSCENVAIDGVILRDPTIWTVVFQESQKLIISNIKLVGHWRYNADGIDIVNSSHVRIENSFIRAFDDCIVIKGLTRNRSNRPGSSFSDIQVDNCVIFNDWGFAIKFGTETFADSIQDVIFRNCDIIHYVHGAMGIHNSNQAHIYDVVFDEMRVEEPIVQNVYLDLKDNPIRDISNTGRNQNNPESLGKLFYISIYKKPDLGDTLRGKVDHIIFRNIHYSGIHYPQSSFVGFDDDHEVTNIIFEKVFIHGKLISDVKAGNFMVGRFVKNIQFK